MLHESQVLSRNPEMVDTTFDDEVVMMSVENGEYYGLDPIASTIWDVLVSPRNFGEVLDLLLQQYDVDRATCKRDIEVFLAGEVGSKLIVVA